MNSPTVSFSIRDRRIRHTALHPVRSFVTPTTALAHVLPPEPSLAPTEPLDPIRSALLSSIARLPFSIASSRPPPLVCRLSNAHRPSDSPPPAARPLPEGTRRLAMRRGHPNKVGLLLVGLSDWPCSSSVASCALLAAVPTFLCVVASSSSLAAIPLSS